MTLENIIEESKELLTEQFEKGVGLRGTPLKRFSGPTLETWSEITIKNIIKSLQILYPNAEIEWSKDYLSSDFEGLGDERLDQHVKVNGKYAYLQEDRAWVENHSIHLREQLLETLCNLVNLSYHLMLNLD